MKIYIGADHRGFELKAKIKKYLYENNYEFEDLGALNLNPDDDYPVYAELVGKKVQANPDSFGILLCGSGVGVEVAANKFDEVRAATGNSVDQVKAGRHDDNMNVLVIASDFTDETKAKDLTKAFLETEFGNEKRFNRRLAEIAKIEKKN